MLLLPFHFETESRLTGCRRLFNGSSIISGWVLFKTFRPHPTYFGTLLRDSRLARVPVVTRDSDFDATAHSAENLPAAVKHLTDGELEQMDTLSGRR